MSISIVNGFVCSCPCDVAKAKKGEDPHPLTGAAKKEAATNDPAKVDPLAHDPAVVFGGALANLHAVPPVDARPAASPANPRLVGGTVDLTV